MAEGIRATCRLAEEEIVRHIATTDPTVSRGAAKALVQDWFLSSSLHRTQQHVHDQLAFQDVGLDTRRAGNVSSAQAHLWANDAAFLAWVVSSGASTIASELKVRHSG